MTHDVLSIHLQRELRSDHAGELGAVFIYRGMMQVAKLKKDRALLEFAAAHSATDCPPPSGAVTCVIINALSHR